MSTADATVDAHVGAPVEVSEPLSARVVRFLAKTPV